MRISILIIFFFSSLSLFSTKLKEGMYRGVLVLNAESGIEVPFNFEVKYVKKKPFIIIHNADEKISVDEISIEGDSVNFKMPVFDTEFRTKLVGTNLEGWWINNYKTVNNKIAFKAEFGNSKRFLFESSKPNPLFEGKWEVAFSPGTKDESKAIGIFHHQEQTDFVSGTFLTETGDYRYLEGMKSGDKLYLSCFDGSHAFLFIANYADSKLVNGKFYSGITWQENWSANRNENFQLTNPEQITLVKNKDAKLNFSFPSLTGKTVSITDKRYENKPLIIQILGSWCPNCMDESAYLSEIYKKYKSEGLEIIGLAFEKTSDFEKAKNQVMRLKTRYNMDYELLITQQTGRDKASEVLPMLNKITAFPTTLFLNKNHDIIKVHTGFSGPATGQDYIQFKNDTELLIKNLLKE
jgi:thiol-disulfide isomerase/thioredoxin